MEPYGDEDLLRQLNAMQEKMGSTLEYWDCRSDNIDRPETATVPDPGRENTGFGASEGSEG